MSISAQAALDTILTHHRALESEVDARTAVVVDAARTGRPIAGPLAALVAYLAGEVLPHALAEEQTIYVVARDQAGLHELVAEMTKEHRELERAIEGLTAAPTDAEIAHGAQRIAETFKTHVAKENVMLSSRLVTDDAIDLGSLLDAMGNAFAAAKQGTGIERDGTDPDATLIALLLKAADELAGSGHGERACQLAASAWAAVRRARPDLAVRITAALHRLARLAGEAPTTADRVVNGSPDGGAPKETVLDVRSLAPAQRHEQIFATYHRLAPGEGFVLVNDHDPKPLRYQFEAEHPGDFTWGTLESGPEVWRVRIGRPPAEAAATPAEEIPELDVRRIPHAHRHQVIFSTFEQMAPGGAFVLVNDHDPRPLRFQFDAIFRDVHTWKYLQQGPDEWRIQVAKTTR